MFRNLIPSPADRYHVIARDYPGFGQSDTPALAEFASAFDHLADVMDGFISQLGLARYSLYVVDYGVPIGFRIAASHPERILSIVVQNGNAYDAGLYDPFWAPIKAYWADKSAANAEKLQVAFYPATTRWFYADGVRDITRLSPDTWTVDQAYLDRPGIKEKQLELLYQLPIEP